MKVCEITNEEALELYNLAHYVRLKFGLPDDEDLIQELVTKACIEYSKFDETKGEKSTFLCNVMINRLKRILETAYREKRKSNLSNISLDEIIYDDKKDGNTLLDMLSSDVDISEDLHKKELYKCIEPLVEEPLFLWVHGMSQREIAEDMGVSKQRVSQIIQRNIDTIRKYCNKHSLCL